LLFQTVNPIYGGITGLVGILVIACLGLMTLQWAKRMQVRQPAFSKG